MWLTRVAQFALATWLMVGSAVADEKPPVRTDLFPDLFEKIRNDADIQRLWRSCPADIYRSEAGMWAILFGSPDVDVSTCEADPVGCYDSCVQARNEEACFALARAFQDNSVEHQSRHWEALFAQACALGQAGGCTNRGGGIRNGGYRDDPFGTITDDVKNLCLYRTFDISCGAGDAWGCTMLGQAFQYGEGVGQSDPEAKRFYDRACDINPDFDACDYAKSQMEMPNQ